MIDNQAPMRGLVTAGQTVGEKMGVHATAEGYRNIAFGDYSHVEGARTTTGETKQNDPDAEAGIGVTDPAAGESTIGFCAHAEGLDTLASGRYSHAEGGCCTASGVGAHSEGFACGASGEDAHAEGSLCGATGRESHAEGSWTSASGDYSHAEGDNTNATGKQSHSGGSFTKAAGEAQTAIGMYNVEEADNTNALFIIGNGTGEDTSRSNAFRVTKSGAVYAQDVYNSTGADYAEMFEWQDGNPEGEDRVGLFVALDGEEIRIAGEGDDALGVISGRPSVAGDMYGDQWQGMYRRDVFGRDVWETVTAPEEKMWGRVVSPARQVTRLALNPDYDPSQKYVSRAARPEWDYVGLLGKLVMRDDGTAEVNGYVRPAEGGIATRAETRTRYRVMRRIDDTHIRVLVMG